MCASCAEKDELIAAYRALANVMVDTIDNLIGAIDSAKSYLPPEAGPIVDGLAAQAKTVAGRTF